jgi:hypothetical protein
MIVLLMIADSQLKKFINLIALIRGNMKLRNLLTNPYLLSLIPFIVILFVLPVKTKKYSLELLRTEVLVNEHYIFYDDLDSNGISEKITVFDDPNSSGIFINDANGIVDQWNVYGNFRFGLKKNLFITGDKENDGKKEIYIFSMSSDSIFIHCISDFNKPSFAFKNRFIEVRGKGIKAPDPFMIPAEMDDLDGDGIKELIFGIGTGFSLTPRRVYAYYIEEDSLVKSPESSYFIQEIIQVDINGDGSKEIIPQGYSARNITPDQAKYHDYSSFLMVLDHNLKFLFEPLEFKGKSSSAFFFGDSEGVADAFPVFFVPGNTNKLSTIYFVTAGGKVTDSVALNFHAQYGVRNKDEFLFSLMDGRYILTNKNFGIVKKVNTINHGTFFIKDIDSDGSKEYVVYNSEKSKLIVYREGLKHRAEVDVRLSPLFFALPFSIKTGSDMYPVMSIQSDQDHFEFGYRKNPRYFYSYIYYLLIYLGILAFVLLVRNMQNEQMKKKYENEKKVTELQMALIRNQLDPHFTLNAINSIIYSVDYGDRDLAADRLRCFAGLYRDLVLSAGSTGRTIEDEISFCERYLSLEKMRFGDKFDYKIDIAENVNVSTLIPKFLIQIHAENALKHGLAPLESGGMLLINIRYSDNDLLLEIKDNGVGRRNASVRKDQSTGKGLEIMDELYSLYEKLYNDRISSEIIDLYDNYQNPSGTKVVLRIRKNINGKQEI